VPKDQRTAALRGLQDLGWIGYAGFGDFEGSYSLTPEGARVAAEKPTIGSLDKGVQEHIEALRQVDEASNGVRKEGLMHLISSACSVGNWDSALVNCFELRKLASRTKDVDGAAFAAFNIGRVEAAQNRWEEALESGDRKGVCYTNRQLGIVYGNKGDHASAHRCFESSISLAKSIGDRDAEAKSKANLAIILDLEGRKDEAEVASTDCLAYFCEIGDDLTCSKIANNLGVLSLSRDKFDVAAEYFDKTIMSCRATKDRTVLAIALVNAGYCYARVGETARALGYTEEALTILRETTNQNLLALAYRNIGVVEFRCHHTKKAFEWFDKSIRAAETSCVEDTYAACCYEYGVALISSATDLRLAKRLLKRASAAYRNIGNLDRARMVETRVASA
jgi:tetratricopeptide (TPR) repeat protein